MSGRVFVALFSGINVGGNRIVKMAELRGLLEQLGFGEVSTYVQSGNAVLRADEQDSAKVAGTLEKAFEARWKFHSRIMVRDLAWLKRAVAGNPYPEIASDPTKLHLFALEREPSKDELARLSERDTFGDEWRVKADVLYLHAPNGLGKSKFVQALPHALKIPMTARNWRTVLALLEMAGRA